MRMEYAVSFRQPEADIQSLLQQCFDNVTESTFEIKMRAKVYTLHYTQKLLDGAGSMAVLLISMRQEKKYHRVEVLEWANRQLLRNYDRSKYNVFIDYDDVSGYYSGRVYPLLIEWEREVRNLFAQMLQKIAAMLLEDPEVPEKAKYLLQKNWIDVRKKKNGERLVEGMLQDVQIRFLEKFLLEKEDDSAVLRQCEWALKDQGVSDEQGLKMREQASSSIWKRFFEPECDEQLLHNQVLYIQMLRERIYHDQSFTKRSYERCMTVLEELLGRMERGRVAMIDAIDTMEKAQFILEMMCRYIPEVGTSGSSEGIAELTERIYTLLSITAERTGFPCPVLADDLSPDALLALIEGQMPAHYQMRLEDMED